MPQQPFLSLLYLFSLLLPQYLALVLAQVESSIPDLVPRTGVEKVPPFSANALDDRLYLPVQIGGIVAAYGLSLVFVVITLFSLSKKRRERLRAGEDEALMDENQGAKDLLEAQFGFTQPAAASQNYLSLPAAQPTITVSNFSYPSPAQIGLYSPSPCLLRSPTRNSSPPGRNMSVDQRVVEADREMAQQQLEEMYRHVMEHECAKEMGIVEAAPFNKESSSQHAPTLPTASKKGRSMPARLNFALGKGEKGHSRTSGLLSALLSPRRKPMKGIDISSPIMTPHTSTFPQRDFSDPSNSTSNRLRVPPPPPPPTAIPLGPMSFVSTGVRQSGAPLLGPPVVSQSIDERLSTRVAPGKMGLGEARGREGADGDAAMREHQPAPLIGLPSSPRAGISSYPLPASPRSPRPAMTAAQPKSPPSAVRTGGMLPLRAYESAMGSPSAAACKTKQTVFEKKEGQWPTARPTPRTAGAVPYSPYQPATPCIPVTPTLVTREDRRRLKKITPKTPTMEMVKSDDDLW